MRMELHSWMDGDEFVCLVVIGKVVRAIVLKKGLPWKTREDHGKDTINIAGSTPRLTGRPLLHVYTEI